MKPPIEYRPPVTQRLIDAAMREPPKTAVEVIEEKSARDELKRRRAVKAAQMRRYRAKRAAKP